MNLQMLKKAMLAYVSAVKFIWSSIAYPLSIVGKKFMNLRGYRVYGNSVQDGTPAPDNPVEIECVGDLSTKNLFDIDNPVYAANSVNNYNRKPKIENGVIYFNTWYSMAGGAGFLIPMPPNTKFTISFDIVEGEFYSDIMYCNGVGDDGVMIDWGRFPGYANNKILTYTQQSDKTHILVVLNCIGGYYKCGIKNLQVELGDTATDYEPYNKYKIPVVARGKNLATAQQVYSNASDYSECTEDGRNCIRCASDGKSYAGINFKENTQYTVRFEAKTVTRSGYEEDTSGEALFAFTHTDGTRKLIVVYGSKDWKYYEATSLANKTIASVGMYPYNYKHWIYINVDTFQIEEGTTATEYEPYIAPVTTNIFLDEPLRKVGDYADYVDFEKQKVVRNIKRKDFDGSEEWTIQSVNEEEYHNFYTDIILNARKIMPILSNRITGYNQYPLENNGLISSTGRLNVCFSANTIDDWKATLSSWSTDGIPLIINYILECPIEETVNLPALPQFKGTTIYEVGTSIKPSGIEAKYC